VSPYPPASSSSAPGIGSATPRTPALARASTLERLTPNALTAARVLLAIAFFAILTPWKYRTSPLASGTGPDWWLLSAAAIFTVAAITDALDGYLARRWNVVTVFGRIMDPFADKLLVIGAFVFLAGPGFTHTGAAILHAPYKQALPENVSGSVTGVQAWMVALILGRELLVTSIRAEAESRGVDFGAVWSGKLKMILQSICIPAVLVLMNMPGLSNQEIRRPGDWAAWAILIIVWATVIVTAWSGIPYVMKGMLTSGKEQMANRK
jgi:CDP-diacylglycerol--glycerol-3-phosphate 3-phosphatidyltransferase